MHPVGPTAIEWSSAAFRWRRYSIAGPQPAQVRWPGTKGSVSGRSGLYQRKRSSVSNSGRSCRSTSIAMSPHLLHLDHSFFEAHPVGQLFDLALTRDLLQLV